MPLGTMRNYVRATADMAITNKYKYNLSEPWSDIVRDAIDSNMAILTYVSRLSGKAYAKFIKLVNKEIEWSVRPVESNPGAIRMTRDEARKYWGIGEIKIDGVMFDFGRMSYGDYFIEPKSKRPKRETDSFSPRTLWGRVDENDKHYLIFE